VKGGLASKPKSLGMPVAGMTYTTVTIRVKDGKAKIDFEDTFFRHSMGTVNFTDKSADTCIYKKWKAAVDEEQIGMIADLKLALTKKLEDF
ncbi:MAG TPA: hypothetical protein PLQ65_09220, partial [Flavihumibacter sp.]|nr:hypothetical protein [Flavihumibacter sp.]